MARSSCSICMSVDNKTKCKALAIKSVARAQICRCYCFLVIKIDWWNDKHKQCNRLCRTISEFRVIANGPRVDRENESGEEREAKNDLFDKHLRNVNKHARSEEPAPINPHTRILKLRRAQRYQLFLFLVKYCSVRFSARLKQSSFCFHFF